MGTFHTITHSFTRSFIQFCQVLATSTLVVTSTPFFLGFGASWRGKCIETHSHLLYNSIHGEKGLIGETNYFGNQIFWLREASKFWLWQPVTWSLQPKIWLSNKVGLLSCSNHSSSLRVQQVAFLPFRKYKPYLQRKYIRKGPFLHV